MDFFFGFKFLSGSDNKRRWCEKSQIFSINNSKRKIVLKSGKTWDQELAINLSIIGIPIAVTSMLDKKDSVSTSLALYLT